MNVTLNTFNNYNKYQNRQQNPRNTQSFTANPTVVTENVVSGSSRFFEPFTKLYEKSTDFLAQYISKPILDNSIFGKIADSLKDTKNLFQHCLTLGSVVTSGLYMQRTLTNKDLEKDRRNTLAVNQGITLVVSTIGAYTLDKYLKSWWENVTAKFVGHQVEDNNFTKDFKDIKSATKFINKTLKEGKNTDIVQLLDQAKNDLKMNDDAVKIMKETIDKLKNSGEEIKSLPSMGLNSFIDKLVKNNRIVKLDKALNNKIKGMGLLRSMIVFGFVYRFFVPVAVTKPSNMLCDKYLEYKKAKQAQSENVQKA